MLRNMGIAVGTIMVVAVPVVLLLNALDVSDGVRLASNAVLVGAASVIGVLLEERRRDRQLAGPPHHSSRA